MWGLLALITIMDKILLCEGLHEPLCLSLPFHVTKQKSTYPLWSCQGWSMYISQEKPSCAAITIHPHSQWLILIKDLFVTCLQV